MADGWVGGKDTIEESALLSVAYFNLLEYAPTTFEVWRHLLRQEKTAFLSVVRVLERLKTEGKIFSQDGFWFLPDKNQLAFQRNRRKKISSGKIKRACRWSWLLKRIPFIKGIFVNGALALGTADRKSDWDILAITDKKRIWLARFCLAVGLEIFRKRRSGRNDSRSQQDRFCLNHFLSEDGLILEKQNQFIAHESGYCFPLRGAELYRKYLNLNYFWLRKQRANFEADRLDSFWTEEGRPSILKKGLEILSESGGWAERLNDLMKKWMIGLIKNNPKTHWPGADIRYTDQALVFIPKPWRDGLDQKAAQLVKKSLP